MRRFRALSLGLLLFGTVLATPPATSPQPDRAAAPGLVLPGRVLGLSADGGRVAIRLVTSPKRAVNCFGIRVWAPPSRSTSLIQPLDPCRAGDESAERALDLTLAGNQLAWTEYDYGNHSYCTVAGATLSRRKARDLEVCDPESHDPERILRGFFGDGSVIAFSTWYQCDPYWYDQPECQRDEETQFAVKLWVLQAGKPKVLREGVIWRTPVSVDAGRIVLLRPNGSVILVRASDGVAYLGFPSPTKEWKSARLQGAQLVIRKREELVVYDATSAQLQATFRSTRATRLVDVQDSVIVTISSRTIRLRRVTDGRTFVITPPGSGAVFAQLERSGLFYAYNRRGAKRGNIVFLPFATVASRLAA